MRRVYLGLFLVFLLVPAVLFAKGYLKVAPFNVPGVSADNCTPSCGPCSGGTQTCTDFSCATFTQSCTPSCSQSECNGGGFNYCCGCHVCNNVGTCVSDGNCTNISPVDHTSGCSST